MVIKIFEKNWEGVLTCDITLHKHASSNSTSTSRNEKKQIEPQLVNVYLESKLFFSLRDVEVEFLLACL
jgi:hypothetical protein